MYLEVEVVGDSGLVSSGSERELEMVEEDREEEVDPMGVASREETIADEICWLSFCSLGIALLISPSVQGDLVGIETLTNKHADENIQLYCQSLIRADDDSS